MCLRGQKLIGWWKLSALWLAPVESVKCDWPIDTVDSGILIIWGMKLYHSSILARQKQRKKKEKALCCSRLSVRSVGISDVSESFTDSQWDVWCLNIWLQLTSNEKPQTLKLKLILIYMHLKAKRQADALDEKQDER